MRYPKLYCLFLVATSVLFLDSCDFLHMAPLKVVGHTPNSAIVSSQQILQLAISVQFNEAVDKNSVEQAFQLNGGGKKISGNFFWPEDKSFVFIPTNAQQPGLMYEFIINDSAEDIWGNSLENGFSFQFSDNPDINRPAVISVFPLDTSTNSDPMLQPIIAFSKPMDTASVVTGTSISPKQNGFWDWNAARTIFTFHPTQPFDYQVKYVIICGTGCADSAGNTLAIKTNSEFTVGTDNTLPTILSAQFVPGDTLTAAGAIPATLNLATAQSGIECNGSIVLHFSKPVKKQSVNNLEAFSPKIPLEIDTPNVLFDANVVLKLSSPLQWNTWYRFTLNDNYLDAQGNKGKGAIWLFRADGAFSKPPSMFDASNAPHIYFFQRNLAAESTSTVLDGVDGNLVGLTPDGPINVTYFTGNTAAAYTGTRTFFDVYVKVASPATQYAQKDLFITRFLASFLLKWKNSDSQFVDGALLFDSSHTATPVGESLLDHAPGTDEVAVRVYSRFLIQSNPGLLEISLSNTMIDVLGNQATAPMKITLIKATTP